MLKEYMYLHLRVETLHAKRPYEKTFGKVLKSGPQNVFPCTQFCLLKQGQDSA